MSASDNVQLVRDFLDAINEWDFDGMRNRLDPEDFVYRIPYSPDWIPSEMVGRDVYVDFAEQWSGSIDGTENIHDLEIDTLANDPTLVVARYKVEFTVTATGYKYENDLICLFTVRNGKIVVFDERLNALPLTIAAGGGIVPPEG